MKQRLCLSCERYVPDHDSDYCAHCLRDAADRRNRAAREVARSGRCCAIGCSVRVPKGRAWCEEHR